MLNRVIGAGGAIDPSVILGALQSNGRVFLINPSGIVFGAGAQIDVAGLVASSLNLSNADFLGGRLRFTEVPGAGAVVNQGSINAASGGQVYLVGPSVTNSGVITSPKGEVMLAAGNTVELVNPGTPNLRVEITAPDNEARNLGKIVADAGRVGIYAGLINQSGTIRADSRGGERGRAHPAQGDEERHPGRGQRHHGERPERRQDRDQRRRHHAGGGHGRSEGHDAGRAAPCTCWATRSGSTATRAWTLPARRAAGRCWWAANSRASRASPRSKAPPYATPSAVFLGADATIAADAIASGDGGKVILWSDDTTRSSRRDQRAAAARLPATAASSRPPASSAWT